PLPGAAPAGLVDRPPHLPLRAVGLHLARMARARRSRPVGENGRDRAVLDRDRAPAVDEPAVPGGCGDPRPVLEEQVEEDVARAFGDGGQLLVDLGVRLGHLFSFSPLFSSLWAAAGQHPLGGSSVGSWSQSLVARSRSSSPGGPMCSAVNTLIRSPSSLAKTIAMGNSPSRP